MTLFNKTLILLIDYSVTVRTEVFRHSAEEKAEFIKDFLIAIGVKK
jgi:hypothetical protein